MIADKINSEVISLARKTSLQIKESSYLKVLINLPNFYFVNYVTDIC